MMIVIFNSYLQLSNEEIKENDYSLLKRYLFKKKKL